jgi:hypothetical protein
MLNKDNLISDIDNVLKDFIVGKAGVENFFEYRALEAIAVLVNKYRTPDAVEVDSYEFDAD